MWNYWSSVCLWVLCYSHKGNRKISGAYLEIIYHREMIIKWTIRFSLCVNLMDFLFFTLKVLSKNYRAPCNDLSYISRFFLHCHSHNPPPVLVELASAGPRPEPCGSKAWRQTHKWVELSQSGKSGSASEFFTTGIAVHYSNWSEITDKYSVFRPPDVVCGSVYSCGTKKSSAAPVFDVEVLAQMQVFEGGVSGESWQHCDHVCIKTW